MIENNPFKKNMDDRDRQSGKISLSPSHKLLKFKVRWLLFGYALGFPMGMFVALGLLLWMVP